MKRNTRCCILLILLIFLESATVGASEQPPFLLLHNSTKLSGEQEIFRCALENELVRVSAVRRTDSRGEVDVYPGIRSSFFVAGSLIPEGLPSIAGTGNFAGYSSAVDLQAPRIRVDLGLEPGKRRGIALFSPGTILYWLRDEDFAESGAAYTFEGGDLIALDFLLSRHRFYKTPARELSAKRRNIGRNEEMFRAASAVRSTLPWIGSCNLIAAWTALPLYPFGYFMGASAANEWKLLGYELAGNYRSPFYVLKNGKLHKGRWALASRITLFPKAFLGGTFFATAKDRGVDLRADLYRESVHEIGGEAWLSYRIFSLEGYRELKWWWETDGGGGYEDTTGLKVELDLDRVKAATFWQRNKYGASLAFDLGGLRGKLEMEEGEQLEYSFELRADIGEDAEIYGRYGVEGEEPSWTLGWNWDLTITGGEGNGARPID